MAAWGKQESKRKNDKSILYRFVGVKYTYKFRLMPSEEQKRRLAQHFGCSRYLYNFFLARRKEQYLTMGRQNNFVKDCKELTKIKKELVWLTEANAQSLQQTIKNLDAAYGNFFEKRAKFPKFKKKHGKQSFRVPQNISLKEDKLHIPKFREGIKCVAHRPVKEDISHCTVSKNKAGQYFCTLLVEKEMKPKKKVKKEVGIDLGIKTLVVDSDGNEYANIKPYRTLSRKIKRLQRKLSNRRRKTTDKKSNRMNKLRIRLARAHQRAKDIRNNHLHQISHRLTNENQVVYLESLAVRNMMGNHRLAGSISDCGWGELVRQLKYKAEWRGRTIIQLDRFFPSSKTCSSCHWIKEDLKLKDRRWKCEGCGKLHDRDKNAAKMILTQGKNTGGTPGIKARGPGNKTSRSSSGPGSKREAHGLSRG
jgi:putative transposase